MKKKKMFFQTSFQQKIEKKPFFHLPQIEVFYLKYPPNFPRADFVKNFPFSTCFSDVVSRWKEFFVSKVLTFCFPFFPHLQMWLHRLTPDWASIMIDQVALPTVIPLNRWKRAELTSTAVQEAIWVLKKTFSVINHNKLYLSPK
jgi:hypothetical protein